MEQREPFDEIANAIHRLRIAFKKLGLEPPVAIELSSIRDGDKFRHLMTRDMILAQPRMGVEQNDPEWVCHIVGIEVRMPAAWRQELKGGRVLNDPVFYSLGDFLK